MVLGSQMFERTLIWNSKKLLGKEGRSLFTHAKRMGKEELVLTNHAGIFGAYWALTHHAQIEHSAVHIVCFPFWLDRINNHHKNNNWGQTLLGFPTIVRSIFKQIYPNYPLDKAVTWKMVQDLRNFTVHELKSMDRVILHDLRNEPYPLDYSGLFTMLKEHEKLQLFFKDQLIVNVPESSEVYNWVKVPRLHKIDLLPERPHTELYTRSPEAVSNPILVMGDGLSVVWLKRDFPQHEIIAIVPDKNAELPQTPANSMVDYNSITKITVDDILDIDENQIIIKLNNKMIEIPKINYVSAIGYLPYSELTSKIPDNQKTENMNILADSWIAPKNIPVGSLTQSLTKFFEETDNLNDTFELQFHHTPSIIEIFRTQFYNNFGIELREIFFDKLKSNIQSLKDPLDNAEELNLFVSTFKDTQNPSTIELRLFEQSIQTIQHDKNLELSKHNRSHKNTVNTSNMSYTAPTYTRSYSTLAHAVEYQGMLPEKFRSNLQEVISIFFQPDREKIRHFDKSQTKTPVTVLTEENKAKMKAVLKEAKDSKNTFSAY